MLPREEQADLLSAPSDPDVETLASTSVSFSMVRHPFERLVSAYQDKVIRISIFLKRPFSSDSRQSGGSSSAMERGVQDD